MELTQKDIAKLFALVGYTSTNDMQDILLNSQTSNKFIKSEHRILSNTFEMDKLYRKLMNMYEK